MTGLRLGDGWIVGLRGGRDSRRKLTTCHGIGEICHASDPFRQSGAEETHANRNGNLHHNGTIAISVVVCVIRITFIIIDAITIVTTVIMIIATIIVVICTISKHLIKSPPPTTTVHRRPQRHLMIIRTSSSTSTSASQSPVFPHQLQRQWKMLLTPRVHSESPRTAVQSKIPRLRSKIARLRSRIPRLRSLIGTYPCPWPCSCFCPRTYPCPWPCSWRWPLADSFGSGQRCRTKRSSGSSCLALC